MGGTLLDASTGDGVTINGGGTVTSDFVTGSAIVTESANGAIVLEGGGVRNTLDSLVKASLLTNSR